MLKKIYITVAFVFLLESYSSADPCPFNADCKCNLTYGIAECNNAVTFPTFSVDQTYINLIIVNGNFTSIPANAFYNLHNLNYAEVYIQRAVQYQQLPLNIDNNAFNTYRDNSINLLELDYYLMTAVPTLQLTNLSCQFSMTYGSLDNVSANAFEGFTSSEISVYSNGLKRIDSKAFNGLKVDQENGLTLFFSYNSLTEISPAFKTINVSSVYLEYNQITQIPDYAFSSCNAPAGCTNMMVNLFISNNPIATIGANAFANSPNMAQLDLSQLSLTSIPVTAISGLGSSLQIIDFTFNHITFIEANSFYGFKRLNSFTIDWNPITLIEPAAFNGMASMQSLIFQGLLNLTSVDLLITYGMAEITTLQFKYCQSLTMVTLSDYTKLPQTLSMVNFGTDNNVQSVDSSVQSWLGQSSSNTLDISNSKNFICNNNISWMAKFAVCSPVQIITNGAYCSNTNITLSDYLTNTFQSTCN